MADEPIEPPEAPAEQPAGPQLSPLGFYSHAAETAQRFPQMKGTPQQFKAMLLKQGVKPDELKWSGYDQAHAGRKIVTRDELVNHFRAGLPKIQETVLGGATPASDRYRVGGQGGMWVPLIDTHTGREIGGGPHGSMTERARALNAKESGDSEYTPPKFDAYTLPGGQSYREVLLHLPEMPPKTTRKQHQLYVNDELTAVGGPDVVDRWRARDPDADIREAEIPDTRASKDNPNYAANYRSAHWDQPNVLAHLRMSDRKGPQGEKILHLEEMQSDWAQEARKSGVRGMADAELERQLAAAKTAYDASETAGKRFISGNGGYPMPGTPLFEEWKQHQEQHRAIANRYSDLSDKQWSKGEHGVPAAPFIDATQKWLDLGLKRLLIEAAKGGYDKIVVTPGEEQAKRYDLSQHVGELRYYPRMSLLEAYDKKGQPALNPRTVKPEDLDKHVGKEVARKLMETTPYYGGTKTQMHLLKGDDLQVGGEGMRSFYDRMLPQALEKLAKKHAPAARLGRHTINSVAEGDLRRNIREHGYDPDTVGIQQILEDHGGRQPRWLSDSDFDAIENGEHLEGQDIKTTALHALDVTPKMRASILRGMAAYAAGGRVPGALNALDRLHEAVGHARGGRADLDELHEHLGKLKTWREDSDYRPPDRPAKVRLPDIGDVEARPIGSIERTARKYMRDRGVPHIGNRHSPFNEAFAKRVADAFDRMKNRPHDPAVKRAYDALIDETLAQYHAAKESGVDFSFLKEGERDPYARSPSLGYADIVRNNRLRVFPTSQGYGQGEDSDNPLLKRVGRIGDLPNATANDAFRVVHDIYGHFGPGNPFFRAPGEERAFENHARMYGPEARKALATETRGQNSWVNYGPVGARNRTATGDATIYAPQKAGLLPDWALGEPYADGGTVEPPPADPSFVEPTTSTAELGRMLEGVRATQIGRMVDRYQKPAPKTAVKRLHDDLAGLAREGEPGHMWYEQSGKRLLDYVGGDKNEAHKLAQLVAIYSPQTTVDINTQSAMKAYNRARSGEKLWAGDILERDRTFPTIKAATDHAQTLGAGVTKVPLDDSGKRFLFARHDKTGYENIATADRDLKAHLLMNEGVPFEGRKTNNFYRNLMAHIDPSIEQGSTQDLWMARAFGFHDDKAGAKAKYDFMEQLTHKLANELGWRPHQVQAAIWTAMKTRQEAVKGAVNKEAIEKGLAVPSGPGVKVRPGQEDAYGSLMRQRALDTVLDPGHIQRSAKDFSHFLDQQLAYASWEATPSRQLSHLQGLEDKPPEVKADYHKRISEALQDEHGGDLLAKYLGMLSPGTVEAPGYWQGSINPASHLQVATTRVKGAGQRPDIDTASKALLNAYADARGLLLKQDGVGYHRPYYNPEVKKANGVELKFNRTLSGDEIKRLGREIDGIPDTALVPAGPDTMRVINFGGLDDHRPYHEQVYAALKKTGFPGTLEAHDRLFASDGDLRTNDWREKPNGEDYTQRLGAAGRSDVLEYLSSVLAPKVQAVDEAFAQEHGLKRDARLEKTLQRLGGAATLGEKLQKATGGAVDPDPTDAQKAAGNYAKVHRSFQGIPVSIENPKGSVRSGVDDRGRRWQARLPADYGYIRRTEGADGDHVDCFLGPDRASPLAVVINQHDYGNGRFDEHKCMLGYVSERAALGDYVRAFSDGKGADRVGSVESMSLDAFKKWLANGDTHKPARAGRIVERALQLVRTAA